MIYNVQDVANKLLCMAESESGGELLTNLKLQKLLYYEQGFHLALFGTPLFEDEIEAWMYGPVVPSVYEMYKAHENNGIRGDRSSVITLEAPKEERLFSEVFRVYGAYSAIGLMNMTHSEAPWKSTPVGHGSVIGKDKLGRFFKRRLK